jgi:hypothetical protein
MTMSRLLRGVFAILTLATATAVQADPAPKIEPMLRDELRPGCGCAFYAQRNRQNVPNDGPLLHWSLAEREWGRSKLDGEIRRLKLLQEKRLPEARERPQHGDRLILVFQEDRYHVQAIGSVTQACAQRAARCDTVYATRLIFRRAGEAPREIEGIGECGC